MPPISVASNKPLFLVPRAVGWLGFGLRWLGLAEVLLQAVGWVLHIPDLQAPAGVAEQVAGARGGANTHDS